MLWRTQRMPLLTDPVEASRIRPGRIALQLRPHLIPENRVAQYPSEEVAFVPERPIVPKARAVALSQREGGNGQGSGPRHSTCAARRRSDDSSQGFSISPLERSQ